ncbi:uncharacterized protein LOC119195106 isoform X2 [Pungitius pungitius]|uniref:uncharacterized protein LOC119195106 isoform X2 n=1 Tax=Pungitius pungitius TaxID=134920 RepID=UPI002E14889C
MSGLLKKIQNIDKQAADELREAGLQSDSDIQVLTRDELRDLLPGNKNMKRRRAIFDIIHKQPIDQILKKVKGFIPEESLRAALTDNGVLVEYLGLLMDMKTQMDKVLTVIEGHIDFLNEYKTNPSDHESASSESKELLVDLMDTSPGETPESWTFLDNSASKDSDSEDLQNPKSDGPPQAAAGSSACSGRTNPEESKSQSEPRPQAAGKVQRFDPKSSLTGGNADVIEGHIDFLNEYKTNPSDHESASSESKELVVDRMDTSPGETPEAGSHVRPLSSGGHEEHQIPQSDGPPQAGAELSAVSDTSDSDYVIVEAPKQPTSYRMVVGGQTFGTHLRLMEEIEKQVQIQLCEDDNHSVTFVFCPISSRVASDVEAAMTQVNDDKPVILVLMHHTHQVRATSTMKTWNVNAKVVLHVNVFYHQTCGLLPCDENNTAVTEIGKELLDTFFEK